MAWLVQLDYWPLNSTKHQHFIFIPVEMPGCEQSIVPLLAKQHFIIFFIHRVSSGCPYPQKLCLYSIDCQLTISMYSWILRWYGSDVNECDGVSMVSQKTTMIDTVLLECVFGLDMRKNIIHWITLMEHDTFMRRILQ